MTALLVVLLLAALALWLDARNSLKTAILQRDAARCDREILRIRAARADALEAANVTLLRDLQLARGRNKRGKK